MKLILLLALVALAFLWAAIPGSEATAQERAGTTLLGPTPFIGQIEWFAGNFAPRGWAFCNGQLLQISQNVALFSLLGTTYGGDGRTTFGLPDLRDRFLMHAGNGPGLTPRPMGAAGGQAQVTLALPQMPVHAHTARGVDAAITTMTPAGNVPAMNPKRKTYGPGPAMVPLAPEALGSAGGGQPHPNRQPHLGLNAIIALQGLYPSRN